MARRLVEAGTKFVEVSLDGWDTHDNNFERSKNLLEVLDPAFSMLLKDLADRDLLEETIVLWLGEFGRTPKINDNDGRHHFPNGWSVVLAGGGIRGGQVIGATSEDGMEVVDRPVICPRISLRRSAIRSALMTEDQNYSRGGRPIRVVNDGYVIKELFA